MKSATIHLFRFASIALILLIVLAGAWQAQARQAFSPIQQSGETPTPTATQQIVSDSYQRPLVVVKASKLNHSSITPGEDFTVYVTVRNTGQRVAYNTTASFPPATGDYAPHHTGGVIAIGEVAPDNSFEFEQSFTANDSLVGKSLAVITMVLTYTSADGVTYTENFALSFPVSQPEYHYVTPTPTPTPTVVPVLRPQLIISSYKTDNPILEPGKQFSLQLNVQNVGNAAAKRVTMIVGGGSSSSGDAGGTAVPGGTSGGSGEFTNFAPLGASNVQSLGDLESGSSLSAQQSLIVNVSTQPGAYSMKISFTYTDEKNHVSTDDQVITLLVYSPPLVDVNFYQDPGVFFSGQPNRVPLQIINLGRKTAVLGNMKVTCDGCTWNNNSVLIGVLEAGGYFTLDAIMTPDQPGTKDLLVTVDYTDDFNQPQRVNKTIQVEIQDSGAMGPDTSGGNSSIDGSIPGKTIPGGTEVGPGGIVTPGDVLPAASESFWDKAWRFIRGLIGLDSTAPVSTVPIDMPTIPEKQIQPGNVVPAPLKGP